MVNNKDIPKSRVVMNKTANIVVIYIFFGIMVTDSQSEFGAYNKKAYIPLYIHT